MSSTVVITSLHLPQAFAYLQAQRRGRLYRFPIVTLSSWSLSRDGEDSQLIHSPPPERGSRTRTRWPIWNYVSVCVCVFEWCSFQCVSVRVNEWSWSRGDWHTDPGLPHTSEVCYDTRLSIFEVERCSLIYSSDISLKFAPHSQFSSLNAPLQLHLKQL